MDVCFFLWSLLARTDITHSILAGHLLLSKLFQAWLPVILSQILEETMLSFCILNFLSVLKPEMPFAPKKWDRALRIRSVRDKAYKPLLYTDCYQLFCPKYNPYNFMNYNSGIHNA